jgi:hypothetical protein
VAVELPAAAYDAALCIGASFVWGTIADAAAALTPAVRPGGCVAIGEPFWLRWPLPGGVDPEQFVGLRETVARFEAGDIAATGLIAASLDDWDRYQSLRWRAIEEWLRDHPDDPRRAELRSGNEGFKRRYLETYRPLLGWAIFTGRKAA